MHLVGFIIRIYHDARSYECQILYNVMERYFLTTQYSCVAYECENRQQTYIYFCQTRLTIWVLLWTVGVLCVRYEINF